MHSAFTDISFQSLRYLPALHGRKRLAIFATVNRLDPHPLMPHYLWQDAEKVRQLSERLRLRPRLRLQESVELNLDLDLSLPLSLRPCLGQGASWRAEGWAGKKVAF
jgi:hypothetical protein